MALRLVQGTLAGGGRRACERDAAHLGRIQTVTKRIHISEISRPTIPSSPSTLLAIYWQEDDLYSLVQSYYASLREKFHNLELKSKSQTRNCDNHLI